MESGLEGRNNRTLPRQLHYLVSVSMESGLEGRNNLTEDVDEECEALVSMESGLEGRNNLFGKNKPAAWTESQWSPA